MSQVERSTGKTPPELILPELPYIAQPIWGKFRELSETRPHGMGPLPITYFEIKSWQELTGQTVSMYEVELIKKIDAVYVRIANE